MGRTFEQLVRGLMIRDWECRDGNWIQPISKKIMTFEQAVKIEYGSKLDGDGNEIAS